MGLCYAAAASALTCAKSHEFCRLAPLWQAELLVKARRLEAGWQVLHAARPLTARKERPEPPRTAAASHIVLGELLFAMGRVDRWCCCTHFRCPRPCGRTSGMASPTLPR